MLLLTFQQTPESLSGKSLEGSLSNSGKLSADDEHERTSNSAAPDASTKEIKLEKETNRSTKAPSGKVISNNEHSSDLVKKEFNSGLPDHHRPPSNSSRSEEIKHESKSESNHVSTSSSLTGSSLSDPLFSSRINVSAASQQPPTNLPIPSGLPPFLPPTGLSQVPLFDPLFASNSKCGPFCVYKGFR